MALAILVPFLVSVAWSPTRSTPGPLLPNFPGKSWVATDPVQCMSNPWEIDWLRDHNWNYTTYPHGPEGEASVVIAYYGKLGVVVYDVKSLATHNGVCAACSCARGDTLYLLVSNRNVGRMLDMGYHPAP